MDVIFRGGQVKLDKLGQGGGGGQKSRIFNGRLLWMPPVRGGWFSFFFLFLFHVHFSLWTFGGSTGNFFFVFADPFELFSGSLILSSPGCFTLKSWVFRVHSNYVFYSLKKLKISALSIQVHWVFRSQKKNSRICSPKKNSLSHRQMSIRKSLHPKKW